jgi:hypothetical protein
MGPLLTRWTVDYGEGPVEVTLPHAWRQDVPVAWEGPAIYSIRFKRPPHPGWLVFRGVSYQARVFLNGILAGEHRGIWDAFSVPVKPLQEGSVGGEVEVRVEVVKNGGPTFPVRDVASGFLPYVYHTFGGIFGEVELALGEEDPLVHPPPAPEPRARVEGTKLSLDGLPWYPRGLLHWGWYPELGHTNAPDETILREVRAAKELGFNLVKFCLWVPPHRYLEILREEGMEAWLELPLWDPTADPARQLKMFNELERIVLQYRRHESIVIWTIGCELSGSTSAEYRHRLYEMVQRHTGSPLIKDNSGGAEMYGGDLREFGDFYDFHPYCDTMFYPQVLDSLLPTAHKRMPILLGEFNDIDAHRDLARLRQEQPCWASPDPWLNEQGVRWQYDLPRVLESPPAGLAEGSDRHRRLMESSRRKALFIRKFVQESVRAREGIGGYAITGWRDTPISTAGFFDDWGRPRFTPDEVLPWNGPGVLFLIPTRRPPWVHGGNRPGYQDSFNHFTGQIFWRVGVHSETFLNGQLEWTILDLGGGVVAEGQGGGVRAEPLESLEVGQIHWECEQPGVYELRVRFGGLENRSRIGVFERPLTSWLEKIAVDDPTDLLSLEAGDGDVTLSTRIPTDLSRRLAQGERLVLLLTSEGTQPAPFWRESALEWDEGFFSAIYIGEGDRWEALLPVSADCVLRLDELQSRAGVELRTLMNRVDTRTYAEAPLLVSAKGFAATTLRPMGGLGIQPTSLLKNPVGVALLRRLIELARS